MQVIGVRFMYICRCMVMVTLLGMSSMLHAAPVLFLDIDGSGPSTNVQPNSSFDVQVLASDIPVGSDGLGLFGFGFSLSYDPAALIAGPPSLGALWSGTGFDSARNLPGEVALTSNRFFENTGPVGDRILLGTIEFTTGSATGTFPLEVSHFSGVGDNILFDSTVLDGPTEDFFQNGAVNVVPIPPAIALFVSALVCIGALGGRQRIAKFSIGWLPRRDDHG